MRIDTKKISPELLQTIKGVHVDYYSSVPDSYLTQLQDFIENWLFENESIKIESWRIQEELSIDDEISLEEAQRQAVVELGYALFLETTELCYECISVSPIT